MPSPKPLRLEDDLYRNKAVLFHCVIRAHPRIRRFSARLADDIWSDLMKQRDAGRVRIVAACLMPEHLHLLVSPRGDSLTGWVRAWKSYTTRRSWRNGIRGALWQARFWDRALRPGEFDDTLRYILENPVAGGYCDDPEAWRWSWFEEPPGGSLDLSRH